MLYCLFVRVEQLLVIVNHVEGRVFAGTSQVLTQRSDNASNDATLTLAGWNCVDLQVVSSFQPIGSAHCYPSLVVVQLVLHGGHHALHHQGFPLQLLIMQPLKVHCLHPGFVRIRVTVLCLENSCLQLSRALSLQSFNLCLNFTKLLADLCELLLEVFPSLSLRRFRLFTAFQDCGVALVRLDTIFGNFEATSIRKLRLLAHRLHLRSVLL